MTPKQLLRAASIAEAITWALLLLGMWLKYGPAQQGLGVAIAGSLHGAAFLSYLFLGLVVGINQRFGWGECLLGGVSSVLPFATIPYELAMERRGRLAGGWRRTGLDGADAAGDATRRPPLERLMPLARWAQDHPLTLGAAAILVAALILAGALRGSLALGG